VVHLIIGRSWLGFLIALEWRFRDEREAGLAPSSPFSPLNALASRLAKSSAAAAERDTGKQLNSRSH